MEETIRWRMRRREDGTEDLPTAEDADEHNCVLVMHAYQGAMVTGWFNIKRNRFVYAWAPCPRGPVEDAKAYRNPDRGLSGHGEKVWDTLHPD